MEILFVTALMVMFLGMLWTPAYLVARKLSIQGDVLALRSLRVILPCQLIVVVVLAFLADAIGLRNPAGLVVAIALGVSLLGAGTFFLFRAFNTNSRRTMSVHNR